MGLTVEAGAEVHGVAVTTVPGNSASSNLHHVRRGSSKTLHFGRAVLRCNSVRHGLSLGINRAIIMKTVARLFALYHSCTTKHSISLHLQTLNET